MLKKENRYGREIKTKRLIRGEQQNNETAEMFKRKLYIEQEYNYRGY